MYIALLVRCYVVEDDDDVTIHEKTFEKNTRRVWKEMMMLDR